MYPVASRFMRSTKPTRSEVKEGAGPLRHIYLKQEVQ